MKKCWKSCNIAKKRLIKQLTSVKHHLVLSQKQVSEVFNRWFEYFQLIMNWAEDIKMCTMK